MEQNKTHIVIVDSGLREDCLEDSRIKAAYTVETAEDGTYYFNNGGVDMVGHGTAVFDILSSNTEADCEFTIVRAFEKEITADFDKLVYTLNYIYENIDCDVLHLSLGVVVLPEPELFLDLIKRFEERKTLIVCAFDNQGVISYPAAFSGVIGVDCTTGLGELKNFRVVEGGVVDVLCYDGYLRTKWVSPPKIIISGTSFSSAYITAKVCDAICKQGRLTKADAMNYLATICTGIVKAPFERHNLNQRTREFCASIKRAVLFPFNKEVHSLLAYSDLLTFSIEGIYDVPQTGNIGKPVRKLVPYGSNVPDLTVAHYESINWEDDSWDCVILGHCGPINQKTGRDVWLEFVNLCVKHHKKVYCFDHPMNRTDLTPEQFGVLGFPMITEQTLPVNRFGKLRYSGKPTIGILGTSSAQGKYTLQLELRKRFLADGYHLGQIGTEPTSHLFGMQHCFPMGYNASVFLPEHGIVNYLNEAIWELEAEGVDVIMAGNQSGTIQYDVGNESRLCFNSYEFLLGVNPDASIVCVNIHDDPAYIKRTISFIEGTCGKDVVALCIYPVTKKSNQLGYGYVNRKASPEELTDAKNRFSEEFKIPAFILGDQTELDALYERVIDFFAEE